MEQNEGKALSPIFLSLIPNLMGGEGHIIPYHQAVNKAVKQLGWTHLVAVPKTESINELPPQWDACLSSGDLEVDGHIGHKVLRIKQVGDLGISIAHYLRSQVIGRSPVSIIFLERFIHLQLFALAIALLFVPTENLAVWLLYRRDTHHDRTRFIYKFLHKVIEKRLKPGRLQLLTDSELLSHSLSDYFQKAIIVMPIPHTDIDGESLSLKESPKTLCWWPGSPRQEKGWTIIKNLVHTDLDFEEKLCLIAAQSSKLTPILGGIDVKLIEDNLSRKNYIYWLCISDIIMLPYDSVAYQERTSGIFTECIIAGKIPLVTANTWMANECLKYDLNELVLDWSDSKSVFNNILEIMQNKNINDKIKQMQADYKKFHTIEQYAQQIQEIYLTTKNI